MKLVTFAPVAVVSLVLFGCNPEGTCITKAASTDGDMETCALGYPKRACANMQGTFFDEAPTAGLLRCKGLGFELDPQHKNYLYKHTRK